MKAVVAMFKHETNTFSPLPTAYEHFGPGAPLFGDAAYAAFRHSGYTMGGLLDEAEKRGAEVRVPFAARALPSGPVEDAAFDRLTKMLCDAVEKDCDVLLLDMHGAMVVESYPDGEGEILRRVRATRPDLPIAVGLDFHGALTQEMLDNSTVLVGYKTYPHLDMRETGQEAASILFDCLESGTLPTMTFARAPLLTNMLRQVTEVSPMADLIALARQAEEDGALSVSIFGGFPLSDTENTGLGVVAVTLKSDGSGQKICDQIVKAAMQRKEDFTMSLPSLQSSVATAKALTEYPVLLIDTADNCHSGGTQDCMGVIQEALKQGLTNILAGPIVDPVAVAEALSVSLGETITVSIGGKSSFAAVGQPNIAMTLTGKVTAEADGKFEVTGPLFTGAKVNMGRTVLFDAGNIRVVISEDRFEAMDFAMYGILGIDVMEADYVVLKSKIQYRPTFGTIAKHIVECHSVGVASLDPTVFAYQHLARPIYPLDAIE